LYHPHKQSNGIESSPLPIYHTFSSTHNHPGSHSFFAHHVDSKEHIFVLIQDTVNWCLGHMDSIALSVHEVEKDLEKAEFQSEAEA
jgi:hypothetical protein